MLKQLTSKSSNKNLKYSLIQFPDQLKGLVNESRTFNYHLHELIMWLNLQTENMCNKLEFQRFTSLQNDA